MAKKVNDPFAPNRELIITAIQALGQVASPSAMHRLSERMGTDNELDYMILFPNPASDETALRFVLNQGGELAVEVFDTSGRLLYNKKYPGLSPAEHRISLPVERFQSGLYLVKARIGSRIFVKELVVQ